jgi:hypothetical protein
METPQHQEWRSRQQVSARAVAQAAFCAGGILFIMSGGTPWSTAGTMNIVMGRDLPLGFFTLLLLHMALAYAYAWVIAFATYRLRIITAILAGVGAGMGLYVLNYAFFHGLSVQMQSPEFRAFLVHFSFSLFATVIYKGASVPRPFRGDRSEVRAATRRSIQATRGESDPEPELEFSERHAMR